MFISFRRNVPFDLMAYPSLLLLSCIRTSSIIYFFHCICFVSSWQINRLFKNQTCYFVGWTPAPLQAAVPGNIDHLHVTDTIDVLAVFPGQYWKTRQWLVFVVTHDLTFSNLSIIHQVETKEIRTVTVVRICDLNWHRFVRFISPFTP